MKRFVHTDLFVILVMPLVWAAAIALPLGLAAAAWWTHTGQAWTWF